MLKNTRHQSDLVFKLAKKRVKTLKKALNKEPSQQLSDDLIHQLRVCSKKLRALLQLYRPEQSPTKIQKVDHAIKEIAQAYSQQRDTFVQQQLLFEATEICKQPIDNVQPLLNYLINKTPRETVQMNAQQVHQSLKKALSVWKKTLSAPSKNTVNKGIKFSYKKAQKLARRAAENDDDDYYHQCRKWTKYLLYQLQQLSVEAITIQNQLNELGDILGKFHDRCVLEDIINNQLNTASPSQVHDNRFINSSMVILIWLQAEKSKYKYECQQQFRIIFANKQLIL